MNRRLIAIILAACLALCLLGCNQEEQPALENPATTEATEATELEVVPGVVVNPNGGMVDLDDTTNSTEQPSENTEAPTEQPITGQTGNEEQTTQDTTEPTEKPSEGTDATEPEGGNAATGATEYERYYNMSGDEQKAFIESFGSIEAFFEWHNAAKAEYEKLHPDIEIEDGSVDLGGGNG